MFCADAYKYHVDFRGRSAGTGVIIGAPTFGPDSSKTHCLKTSFHYYWPKLKNYECEFDNFHINSSSFFIFAFSIPIQGGLD